jgi:hypothetical protein
MTQSAEALSGDAVQGSALPKGVSRAYRWDELRDIVHHGRNSDPDLLGVLGRAEPMLLDYRKVHMPHSTMRP